MNIERKNLVEALERVSATISNGSTMASTKYVLIKKINGKLALITTDLSAFSMALIDCDGESEAFCLDHISLLNTAKTLRSENVELELTEGEVKITGDTTTVVLPALSADEFPQFPNFDNEGITEFELESDVLQKCVKHTAFAAANSNDTRAILECLNISINSGDKNYVTFTALDGTHLAMITTEAKNLSIGSFMEANVPADLFSKIVQKNKGNVKLKLVKTYLFVEYSTNKYVIRLYDGKFVDVSSIIKSSCQKENKVATFKINKEELINSCNLVNILEEKKGILKVKDQELILKASGKGKIEKILKIEGEVKEETEVLINTQALAKGLSVIDDDNLIVHFYGETKPVIVNPASGYNFLYLRMPLRKK